MKKVLIMCFVLIIPFITIGCNDKDFNVDSYKELFNVNTIVLTQDMNHRKIIKNKNEINTVLSILKLETQNFNKEYLELEEELVQKLSGYFKIEITALSKKDRDYSCYYITENGILYEQINNFVRYTEQYAVNYSDLLNFIYEYEE